MNHTYLDLDCKGKRQLGIKCDGFILRLDLSQCNPWSWNKPEALTQLSAFMEHLAQIFESILLVISDNCAKC